MNNSNASMMAQFSKAKLLQEYQTDDGIVMVFENDNFRWIQSADGSVQSAMNKTRQYTPVLPYFPILLSALLFSPAPQRALVIGLGGGELIRFFNHHFPTTLLYAVEKNASMDQIFSNYFQPQEMQYNLLVGDICAHCIDDKSQPYDLVFLDVYAENALPDCFYHKHFFEYMARLLCTSGTLAINLVVKDEHEAIEILQLIRQAFERKTLCLSVGKHMNIVVLAFRHIPHVFTLAQLNKLAANLSTTLNLDYQALLRNIINSNPNDGISLSFY